MRNRLRGWLAPQPPSSVELINDQSARSNTIVEVLIVFAVTLGLSGVNSLLSLVGALLTPIPLNQQQVAINRPRSPIGILDLLGQLTNVLELLAWGALGVYLLRRSGIKLTSIGIDRDRPGRDLVAGTGLAALIGIPGLGLYFAAHALGLNLTVLPTTLGGYWWRVPVLVLAAVANAWAEEVLVVGYLLTRLRELGRWENGALAISALLRGSYHLYQGFGGFLGNVAMGLVFGRVWQRTNRLWPLILAHTLLDVVSFVGYALLAGHLSFLRR